MTDWYDVPLDPEPIAVHFGLTLCFGRSKAEPYLDERSDTWRIRGSWDVTYRVLIDLRNIEVVRVFRERRVREALAAFEQLHGRAPTPEEVTQLTTSANSYSNAVGAELFTIDGIYNHELLHILAFAVCIAFDAALGELASLEDLAKTSTFPDELRAQAFANEWATRVMIQLRVLQQRATGHDAPGIAAAIGGLTGALLPGMGLGLAPPNGTLIPGPPAPSMKGDAAAWETEKLDLQLHNYFALNTQ